MYNSNLIEEINSSLVRYASEQKMHRFDLSNKLIKKFGFKKYLEIGIFHPVHCFDKIEAEIKHSVDPGVENPDNPAMYKLTSDEFFKQLESGMLDLPPDYKWDVIFIDGLHISTQVLDDVNNALRHLSEDGYIVLHDCNPPHIFFQREDYFIDGIQFAWNGTVWKVPYYLRCHREDLKVCVIDTDWGLGIIKKQNSQTIPFDNPFFEYRKMEKNRESDLGLIQIDQLDDWLSS
jgi:hypothetical protein